jgi:hypothetical protein
MTTQDNHDKRNNEYISKFGKFFVWILSLLGSVLLTAFFKDYWEAPRPILQITGFEFRSVQSEQGEKPEVIVENELLNRIERHLFLPDLEPPITVDALEQKVREYERLRQTCTEVEKHLGNLTTLLLGQGAAISLDTRRKATLQMIADAPDSRLIESAAKVLADDVIDPKYQSHPAGSENLRVNLRDSIFDLSQIDEEKVAEEAGRNGPSAATQMRIQAHRTNIYRRLLIYYEPDVLVSFFNNVKDKLASYNREAEDIIGQLQKSADAGKAERIALDVLVSNRGQRPIAISGLGVLRLEVPPVKKGKMAGVFVPMIHTSDSTDITIIDGGKASTIHLLSRESVGQIIQANSLLLGGDGWTASKSLDESRLFLLFRAKTGELTATVSLARAGEEPQSSGVGPSAPLSVSQSAVERTIEEITKNWQTQEQ